MKWLVAVAGLAASLAILSSPRESCAYVRTLTPTTCNPVHWAQTCVFVTVDAAASPDVALSDFERIAEQATSSWAAQTGSFLELHYAPATGSRDVAVDGWQTLVFRTDRWCRPATGSDPEICYDAAANALTTLTYVHDASDPSRDGRILDADIELNGVDAAFYDADSSPAPKGRRRATDLWNTLTHELGHLQGLDHTCRSHVDSMPSCARDERDQPVTACDDVEAHHRGDSHMNALYTSTMYPTSTPGSTNKRTPEADDRAGIAALYPRADDPGSCASPSPELLAASETATPQFMPASAGCQTGRTTSPADLWLGGLAVIAFGWARRRFVATS